MILRLFFVFSLAVAALLLASRPSMTNQETLDLHYMQFTKSARTQIDCLAENIYFESAHEPWDGRVAVALVTMNRLQDPRYPKTVCNVVKQKTNSTCQFSWYCESGKVVRNHRAYKEALNIAIHVYSNYEKIHDLTKGALFYHADYVNPKWRGVEKTTVIGRHIFYKEI